AISRAPAYAGRSDVLRSSRFASRGLLVCLAPGIVSGLELIALLIHVVTAAIHPLRGLVTSFASPILYEIASFFRSFADGLPHFRTSLGSIKDANHRADSEPCKKPKKTIAVTIRHKLTSCA